MVLGSEPVLFFFVYVKLLMCGWQLSISLSDTDILKLEPMAAWETWKFHLTKLKALLYVLGQKKAGGWKVFKKEHIPFSPPRLIKYSI